MPDATILLVPGAWHTAAHFGPLIAALRDKQIDAEALELPSCAGTEDLASRAEKTVYDDAAAVQEAITRLIARGRHVLVVGHSYGGWVVTQAVTEELTVGCGKNGGGGGGVVGLVYMAAYMSGMGDHMVAFGTRTEKAVGNVERVVEGGVVTLKGDAEIRHMMYNDMSPEDASHWTQLLQPMSRKNFTSPTTNVGWLLPGVEVLYIKTRLDHATPFNSQELMIAEARKAGKQVREVEVEASHSPYLSMPGRIAEILAAEMERIA